MTGVCTCGETRPLIGGLCARCRCSCEQDPPCESCFNETNLIRERDHYRAGLIEIRDRCRQARLGDGVAAGVRAWNIARRTLAESPVPLLSERPDEEAGS